MIIIKYDSKKPIPPEKSISILQRHCSHFNPARKPGEETQYTTTEYLILNLAPANTDDTIDQKENNETITYQNFVPFLSSLNGNLYQLIAPTEDIKQLIEKEIDLYQKISLNHKSIPFIDKKVLDTTKFILHRIIQEDSPVVILTIEDSNTIVIEQESEISITVKRTKITWQNINYPNCVIISGIPKHTNEGLTEIDKLYEGAKTLSVFYEK